jgi:hypothetical protein
VVFFRIPAKRVEKGVSLTSERRWCWFKPCDSTVVSTCLVCFISCFLSRVYIQ